MKLVHHTCQPAPWIYTILSNADLFTSLHPVITKMESKGGNNYTVFETLQLVFFKWSFTYPASIHTDAASGTVVLKSVVFRVNKMEIRFIITEKNGYAMVEESIQCKTIWPLNLLMQRIIRNQHLLLFARINNAVTSEKIIQ